MFKTTINDIAASKASALGVFNKALAKLDKASKKVSKFKESTQKEIAKLELEKSKKASDLLQADVYASDIAANATAIKQLLRPSKP